MRIPIASESRSFQLSLVITVKAPMQLNIKVSDPSKPYSDYLRRKAVVKKRRRLLISLPVSPKALVLEIHNSVTGTSTGIQITQVALTPLTPQTAWMHPAQHRFMEFAIDFAQKVGYVPTGFYESPAQEFLFQLLPKLTDAQGKEVITPARIHRHMPRVQISQRWFRPFSIPIRVAILAHEGCHWFLNARSQTIADRCGIRHYLGYGFPKIEAIYAVTKIFGSYPELVGQAQLKRTQDLIQFIESTKE